MTTLESRASPGTSPETGRASPHIDVCYERAGPLQRSKELVGLGYDSIMCVSSLRSRRLEVFGLDERKNRRARGRHARPVLSCAH